MANLLATDIQGQLVFLQDGQAVPSTAVPAPGIVTVLPNRPSSEVYQNRRYIVGLYRPGVCLDEYGNVTGMGMGAPSYAPTLTASGTGITGNAIGYITFVYKVGSVVIAESNPSPATGILSLTNQGRSWTNLPTVAPNPKTTHIRGYVSMAGAVPLLAWERPLGVTTVTENVPTASLGASLPVDTLGNLTFSHGVPPPANFIRIYHDRAWYNDPSNPTYVWYSEIGQPEAVGGLNFIQTRDREIVTAINRTSDVLVVQGQSVTYDLQGYTTTDFTLRKITSSIGCVNHFTCVLINEVLWFLSQDGVYTYNGATFRFMMKKVATYFRTDYLANRALYENAFAADDRYDHLYKLLLPTPGSEARPNYWVCPYSDIDPSMAGLYGAAPGSQGWGTEPIWSFDNRHRTDYTMIQALSPGSNRGDFFVASVDDNFVRKENVEADAGDDTDTNNKTFSLTHGHNLLKAPGGDQMHGKQLEDLDVFGTFENAAGSAIIWCGDESAATAPISKALGGVGIALVATASAGVVPKEDQFQKVNVAGSTGRGYTLKISVTNAQGNEYRGHEMSWKPIGVQSRTPSV